MVHCKEANIVFQGITRIGTVYSRQKSRGLVLLEVMLPGCRRAAVSKEGIEIERGFRGERATTNLLP